MNRKGLVMRMYDDFEYLGRNASRRPAFSNDGAGTLRQTGEEIKQIKIVTIELYFSCVFSICFYFLCTVKIKNNVIS
ncbi:hypothetical protein FACS189474_0930 [Bacteroidia bacterium]|nr:hypothetical protein FACS189474_0930 [Bacteroidia bacterium]